MDFVSEMIADYATTVIALLIAGAGILALAKWKQLGEWLKVQHAKNEQDLLWSIAQEAYVRAEALLGANGQQKMEAALSWALEKLKRYNKTGVTAEEMQTKIEEAWVKLEKIPKGK